MANEETELTDAERDRVVQRAQALILTVGRGVEELTELLQALRTKKVKRSAVDDFGEPTYAFEVKVKIPDSIKITRKMRDYALGLGFNATSISAMWTEFTEYYRKTGKKWQHWGLVWQKWVRTEKTRRDEDPGKNRSSRDMQEL